MTTTIKKPITPEPEPTVARAMDILEGPERSRRAAELEQVERARVEAQQVLVQAGKKQLEVLHRVGGDVEAWFAARPMVEPAQFLQAVGERPRNAIKRAIDVGVPFKEQRAGAAVRAQLEAELQALATPLPPGPLEAITKHLEQLEESEAGLLSDHQAWLELRRQAAAMLAEAVAIVQGQVAWLNGSSTINDKEATR